MLEVLSDFVTELRRAGLAVSQKEQIDAAVAVREIPLENKEMLRSALAATLIKSAEHRRSFDVTFDVYFSPHRRLEPLEEAALSGELVAEAVPQQLSRTMSSKLALDFDAAALDELLREALLSGEEQSLRFGAQIAVLLHAGIEAGRPVGVSYYLHRTLRALNLDTMIASIIAGLATGELDGTELSLTRTVTSLGRLGERLVAEELAARADLLRRFIEAAITEILVADRGVGPVVSSLRRTALSDVDFVHATKEELSAIRQALFPLARLLASRLAHRRRQRHRGPLDFRATIRRSLSTGGVPIEPQFSPPHPSKPELVVIADISGSVASFARFTIQLVFAISSQFSKVQSFVFVDGLDDVTSLLKHSSSLGEAIDRVATEADVTHLEGHSDYGHALSVFCDRYLKRVTSRADVLILGDARNNYHAAKADLLEKIARRARHLYWLNPEPRAYWGSGDSIIDTYGRHCDAVFECRNLRQLEAFVSSLA